MFHLTHNERPHAGRLSAVFDRWVLKFYALESELKKTNIGHHQFAEKTIEEGQR
jgi:hypothetical protein